MQNYLKYFFLSVFSIVIFDSCTPTTHVSKVQYATIPMDSGIVEDQSISKFIEPYKDSLAAQMNEVLVISEQSMVKKQPESTLSNLLADLSYKLADSLLDIDIDMCLLNFGGIRTALPKGPITRGKVFELMPFENELVAITINKNAFDSLMYYVVRVGGQPLSGVQIKINSDKTYQLYKDEEKLPEKETYTIITTDYLAQGGDKMYFFLDPIKSQSLHIKFRDAIIHYFKQLGKHNKMLTGKVDGRIQFIQ